MRTIVAYTEEIDDLDMAAAELLEQTRDFTLAKNSLAILYAEEDADYCALYERLSRHWDFPVMGCSAMAMLAGQHGYCRSGISVLILTADDCRFSVGITGEMTEANYRDEVTRLYRALAEPLDEAPKLGLCYYSISVFEPVMSGSAVLSLLDELSGGMPVYGGAASDNLTFVGHRAFFNGQAVKSGVVLALVSGSVHPRFVRVNSVEHTAPLLYEITRSDGNVVHRLGADSFMEAMRRENMRVDQENLMSAYILSPFVVTIDKGNGDRLEVARVFSSLNMETGSGIFLGVMPEGASLSIGLLTREDVCRSLDRAFDRVLRELKEPGNECSVLLCNSCSARFLALMNDPSAESESYLKRLPEGIPLAGFYAYGEYCPVRGEATGKEYNMFHNFTFTILAL